MADRRTLIFGKNGQIAQGLVGQFPSAICLGHEQADFRNPQNAVNALKEFQPSLVINAAAYTEVDKAEVEPGLAQAINADAPFEIADWCKQNSASLIHYSTDYVYPGTGETPWTETDSTAPVNRYGRTKLAGEQAILESGCHAIVLRTSWVFSSTGRNFVRTMDKLGRERKELSIVNDQVGSPTYAPDIAEATQKIASHHRFHEVNGIFNLTNAGWVTWYDFSKRIFAELAAHEIPVTIEHVIPIASRDYKTPAQRPLNSRLNTQKIKEEFGIVLRPWEAALANCIDLICKRPEL
jgi:dTDP-4-dehydrorhamnose reductase